MSDVSLSKAVRQNLLSLQSTANSMAKTQTRLATGLKVNTALDNPTNFFTASSLNGRAGDMANLLDSMSSGIKTIEAADNGLSSITKTVESMQSTLRQARQDKSFQSQSVALDAASIGTTAQKTISFSGGAVGDTPVAVNLNTPNGAPGTAGKLTFTFTAPMTFDSANKGLSFDLNVDNGQSTGSVWVDMWSNADVGIGQTVDNATEMRATLANAISGAGISGVTVGGTGNDITIESNSTGANSSVGVSNFFAAFVSNGSGIGDSSASGTPAGPAGTVNTVDATVQAINNNASLTGKVRASNDGGKLRIENLSTEDLTVAGIGSDGEADGSSGIALIGGNDVRKNLVKQFNDLRDQLDKFADDASFNGINLLRGDKLKLTFNETGTSTIEIQAADESGQPTSINNSALGIATAVDGDFDSDENIDARLDTLKDALGSLRSQSSTFGSNLSVVENRNDFTKKMINTLETGAANLTLADTNEEAANLLALQTRQQLSSSALSMASQADQAVLRLF